MTHQWPISVGVAYAIELSGGLVTAARARHRQGGHDIDVIAERLDPAGDDWKRCAAIISAEQAKGTAIVSLLAPAQDSFIRPVEAPFASTRKAQAVFPSLLDVELPFPLEQCAYTFVDVQQTTPGRVKAIALAMPADRLQQHVNACAATTSIEPELVAPEALVLWRAAGMENKAASPRPVVILHLAHDRTVAVAGRSGAPVNSFSARSSWSDGDSGQEKLKSRLQQFLAGSLRNDNSEAVEFLISGPLADHAGDSVREFLNADVSRWHIMPHAKDVLVRALAQGALQSDAWTANLRNGSREHPNLARLRAHVRGKLATALIIASVVLMGLSIISLQMVNQRNARAQIELKRTASKITGSSTLPYGQELLEARRMLESSAPQDRALDEWLGSDVYQMFLETLAHARSRDVVIENIRVNINEAILRGAANDWNDADGFAGLFSGKGWKAEIERSDAGTDERVHFVVRAKR